MLHAHDMVEKHSQNRFLKLLNKMVTSVHKHFKRILNNFRNVIWKWEHTDSGRMPKQKQKNNNNKKTNHLQPCRRKTSKKARIRQTTSTNTSGVCLIMFSQYFNWRASLKYCMNYRRTLHSKKSNILNKVTAKSVILICTAYNNTVYTSKSLTVLLWSWSLLLPKLLS